MTSNKLSTDALAWRLEGPFDSTYSLALLNREIARALSAKGVNVALHSTEGPGDFAPSQEFLGVNPDLRVMHDRASTMSLVDADAVSRNLYPPRVADMQGKMNLLHSYAWEESTFPMQWVRDFNNHLTGMTCLSSHVKKTMQDNGVKIPMVVGGCGVDHWDRVQSSKNFAFHGTQPKAFRFLHVSSFFPRKGPDALLEAYGAAFTADDDVTLVIKTFPNIHNRVHDQLAYWRGKNSSYPDVLVIEGDLADEDLKALYEHCHVLVGPSCAEGFGLPFAEAMLSGLPVITTAWSGQLDFCNSDNSWLVDYRFEQAETHFNLLPSAWAAVDVGALSQAMHSAYKTPERERRAMAERGRKLLAEKFSWGHVAQRLLDFRKSLLTGEAPPPPRIGWVSTWNVKCGIATYSHHLLGALDWQPVLLAGKDPAILSEDSPDCIRCWTVGKPELDELAATIDRLGLDTIVIQFNYGFFDPNELAALVAAQKKAGRTVLIELHATIDPPQSPERTMAKFAPAIAGCDRVLVHSIADMNRMKAHCPVEKLILFPHGILEVPEPPPIQADTPPLIATYGFCLPHKGLPEVLEAVALLRDRGIHVNLSMVNAEYPIDFSHALAEELRQKISALNLGDRVFFESRFLSDADSLKLLQAADLIAFAYHPTSESASGAVRYGLACGRPTIVTNLPIFEELGQAVWRVDGHSPELLADRFAEVLHEIKSNSELEKRRAARALNWKEQHKYPALSQRLGNIIAAVRNDVQYQRAE